ncbi:MAG TPA: ATP-grasp domain-containing protein [Candidatus Paceibacterota bacterium]
MSIRLKKPLVYVTRDIERALGMKPEGKYFIVSNDTPHGREIQAKHPDHVFLVKNTEALDTHDLLALPEVEKIISKLDADLVVFQNTPRIERIAAEMKWNLINPSAALARKVEEKISQVAWLGEDAGLLPPHKVTVVKDVTFKGKRFVLQFNHSHTGQGTFVIESAKDLEALKAKFPDRECRIVDFVDGPVFTINASVNRARVLIGSPSYQITGLQPFTDLPFSTIGNDWALPTGKERRQVAKIARIVGKRLKKDGWRGLFGIDAIKDAETGKMYLLEINARQAASAVFESTLQKTLHHDSRGSASVFQAHIAGLLNRLFPTSTSNIYVGAQIVSRVTKVPHTVDVGALREMKLAVTEYENDAHNKELFRIQSHVGIMEDHNVLNALGKKISSCIK